MNIVLATSPHVRHPAVLENDFERDPSAMYSFAPVGLLSLAAVLREDLHVEPVLFDLNQRIVSGDIPLDAVFYQSAASRICAHEPDVLGFMTECDSYHHVLQIMAEVKRQRPDCQCVLGGPHASAVAKPTMERHSYVDAIVIGEGERTFPALLQAFAAGGDDAPGGVLRRRRDSGLCEGGSRPLAPELDVLPIPAYDLYRGSPEEEIFVEVGRGCPFQCTFCSTAPFWQRRHRVKSPNRILAEIHLVQLLFQSKRVHFTHDLLTTDKRWVGELCRALIGAGTPVKWTCSARTDTVDRELLELMAQAGCSAIYFGLESGSQRVLKDIKKDIPVEHSLDMLRLCRDVGIKPNAGLIVGFPSDDRESVEESFDMWTRALEIGTRPVYIFMFCPFAASSMYPQLDTLACDGHFVDIPIDPALDDANRALIASDRDLYGAYYRPRLDVLPTRLQGVDEFSGLATAMTMPALTLSRAVGGMLEVFNRWTTWIEVRNVAVGAPAHRRFYGSPLHFSEFLIDELRAIVPADDPMLQVAEVMRTSFEVARKWSSIPPTSMASHRAVAMPNLGLPLRLHDELRLNTVVATMRLTCDVLPLLDADPEAVPPLDRTPTYVMWDLAEDRNVRLSRVDPFLCAALEQLQRGPQPVAALMANWVEAGGDALDYDRVIHVLTEARTMRFVETV